MDNAECGSVCLAIILAYFGRFVTSSETREACDVTRDGSKAINIIKAARQYGLEAHGMQLSLEEVQSLPSPFIVYWEFNHFLVVEGFIKNHVYLNDPASGHRRVSLEEFSRGFTGIVLFMDTGPEFQMGGKPETSLYHLLRQLLVGSKSSFLYIILLGLLLIIPLISSAYFAKIFFDNILLADQNSWLPFLLIALFLAAIFMAMVVGLQRYQSIHLNLKLKLSHSANFLWRLLNLPLNFFQQRSTGDLAQRLEAQNSIADFLTNQFTQSILNIFILLILSIVMFFISWPLALINLLIGVIHSVLKIKITARFRDLERQLAQLEGKLSGIEMNGLQIIETLKANAVENHFFNHWAAAHAQKISCEQKIKSQEEILNILPTIFLGLNLLILLSLGAWLILQGQLSPGGLMALFILLFSFHFAIINCLELNEYFAKLKAEEVRIMDVMEHPLENILFNEPKVGENLQKNDSNNQALLELRQLQFGYSKLEPPIFTDISLTLKKGESLAIVGPTGGGKSSLAKLICGLYPLWSGEILIQGLPLNTISRAELAQFIGVVDQQIFLFAATVRDNLTLWNPEISDVEIYQALKLTEMEDLIKARGGLNSWVEERGRNFSGGQVERLEIARSLIANPHLLILDEATSALDPIIEQRIYANLQQRHCTLMIIAHRLSAIRDCDQIIVINEGHIVQKGGHDHLMADSGLYKDLVSLEIQ